MTKAIKVPVTPTATPDDRPIEGRLQSVESYIARSVVQKDRERLAAVEQKLSEVIALYNHQTETIRTLQAAFINIAGKDAQIDFRVIDV